MQSLESISEEEFNNLLLQEMQRQSDPVLEKIANYLQKHSQGFEFSQSLQLALYLRTYMYLLFSPEPEEMETVKYGDYWYKVEKFAESALLKRFEPEDLCQDYLEISLKELATS